MPTYTGSADPMWRFRQLDRFQNAMSMVAGQAQRTKDRKEALDQKKIDREERLMIQNPDYAIQVKKRLDNIPGMAEKRPAHVEFTNYMAEKGAPVARGKDLFEGKYTEGVAGYGQKVNQLQQYADELPGMTASRDMYGGLRLNPNQEVLAVQEQAEALDQPYQREQAVFAGMTPQEQSDLSAYGKAYGVRTPEAAHFDPSKLGEKAHAMMWLQTQDPESATYRAVAAQYGLLPQKGKVEEHRQKQAITLDRQVEYATANAVIQKDMEDYKHANRLEIQDLMTQRSQMGGKGKKTEGGSLFKYGKEWHKLQNNKYTQARAAFVESQIAGGVEGASTKEYDDANPREIPNTIPDDFMAQWAVQVKEEWMDPVMRAVAVQNGQSMESVMEEYIRRYSDDVADGTEPKMAFLRSLGRAE